MTSLTAKVPEALQKKNAVEEEAYMKRLETNIQKRQQIAKRCKDKETDQKIQLEIKQE